MSDESSKIDSNQKHCLMGVTNAVTPELRNIKVASASGRVLVSATVSGVSAITVANEATDETCFPCFFISATGDLAPKTNAGLTFNSNTGSLGSTLMTTRKISLGGAGVATGSIEINGTTSGTVTLKVADIAGTWTMTLPANDGDASQFLQTNGSGVLTWAAGGSGTVTSVSVVSANGISGTVATETTTPAITLALGVITPTSVNGLTLASQAVGFTITGGTTSKTLTVALDASVSGTNTGDGTYGIADTNYVKINAADVADNDYAKFTASGLEGRSYSEVLSDIGGAPTASPTLTGTVTLSDNCRVDLTLPTADTYCTGNTTDSFNAGYSSAVGDLVFFGSGGKWLETDSNAVATCKGLMGIALEAKTDGQAMKVALPGSMVRLDAWNWTVGDTLYAGETLGAMQNTIPTGADAIIKVVGFAVSADVIYFNPSPDQQSTVA